MEERSVGAAELVKNAATGLPKTASFLPVKNESQRLRDLYASVRTVLGALLPQQLLAQSFLGEDSFSHAAPSVIAY